MINAKYQSGTSFCIEISDSTSRTCMTVADAVRLKEELTKAIDDAEKDTIERIIGYLGECDLEHTILDFDKNGSAYIDFESLEMLIRKAMEENNG